MIAQVFEKGDLILEKGQTQLSCPLRYLINAEAKV